MDALVEYFRNVKHEDLKLAVNDDTLIHVDRGDVIIEQGTERITIPGTYAKGFVEAVTAACYVAGENS